MQQRAGLTAVSSLVCFSDLVHENAMLYGSALRVVWGREHVYSSLQGDHKVGVAYLPQSVPLSIADGEGPVH